MNDLKTAVPAAAWAQASAEGQTALVRQWARELGFSQIGVSDVHLATAEPGLLAWLEAGFHGSMDYMAAHGLKRARPAELVPGTVRVITARMDYLPAQTPSDWRQQEQHKATHAGEAVVSLYARGRDYHKVLRTRLQRLADTLAAAIGPLGYRVFCDSAPLLEVELAQRSGLGWRGKHTLLLDQRAGSMFFLGEICIDFPLQVTGPLASSASDPSVGLVGSAAAGHCGRCQACLSACPTGAIVAPYRLDARRCLSYLTIEHAGPIPLEWRTALGSRVYGCDECQLVCPWNKFAQRSPLPDFDDRGLGAPGQLLALWRWDEAQFLRRTEGSAIRRIGFERWQRNVAVALGNAWRQTGDVAYAQALQARLAEPPAVSALVAEHIHWALAQRQASPSS